MKIIIIRYSYIIITIIKFTNDSFLNGIMPITLQQFRLQSTLVIAEHSNAKLNPLTQNALTAASKIGCEVTVLIAGKNCKPVSYKYFLF